MATLFLSAPKIKTLGGSGFYRTFDTIVRNGIGPGYGTASTLIARVYPGNARCGVRQRSETLRAGRCGELHSDNQGWQRSSTIQCADSQSDGNVVRKPTTS